MVTIALMIAYRIGGFFLNLHYIRHCWYCNYLLSITPQTVGNDQLFIVIVAIIIIVAVIAMILLPLSRSRTRK